MKLKVSEYYPDRIGYISINDENTGKWAAALCIVNDDGTMGDILVSTDEYKYKTPEDAIDQARMMAFEADSYAKEISN